MNSIQLVLNTYDLQPGDVIYVDSGSYVLTATSSLARPTRACGFKGPFRI